MIKIYHNKRCKKSREGLELLKQTGKEFQIINYLENPLGTLELEKIINLLRIAPIDLIRKNESIWKTEFKGKTLTDLEIVKAMAKYPKLIERPIIVTKNSAIIGRPPERIFEIV